ncbi:type-2 fimbrial major subunit [Chryseobacterium sp. StRB126]|uniref:hypothetical protein n=1 Tax=Chryseobacterium sp. StRB126 TaxID=878220 RepID=UPI0004E98BAA|nr:hypothetical protein [Chryseobacterium sp. StRB126]BAP33038.1 type-2 fimbrial major subunit [Chryseobacterium sp. StRB126]
MNYLKKSLVILFFQFILFSYGQSKEININTFKVYGNDKADVTGNFDKAIEYISTNGGTLYIPKGNYYLDNKNRIRKGINNNSYIFLVKNNFKIKLNKEAVLYYRNNFKGFRFRSTQDPNDKTINNFEVEIEGGTIDCSANYTVKTKGNPDIWAFVGETLKRFKATNMVVRNLYGTAAIGAGFNDVNLISDNRFENVTGNPLDYIDNHGNGIYIANSKSYEVKNNKVINNLNITKRLGTVGICIEGEGIGDGVISGNEVTGYDRGIHVEHTEGTSTIINNHLIGNSSGVVLWDNNGYKQIVESNIISNKGLSKNNKPILYTSAPLLILGYNTNEGTIIKGNTITLEKDFFIPNELLQVTSNNVAISNNTFYDETGTLSLSIAQGRGQKQKVRNISFFSNKVKGAKLYVYDASDVNVSDNQFDVDEAVFSFDNSNNVYKNNSFPVRRSANKIQLFGKYMIR